MGLVVVRGRLAGAAYPLRLQTAVDILLEHRRRLKLKRTIFRMVMFNEHELRSAAWACMQLRQHICVCGVTRMGDSSLDLS